MSSLESLQPPTEETLPLDELGPEVEDMIYRFRNALLDLPEFKDALACTYLAPGASSIDQVDFLLGDKQYRVRYGSHSGNEGIDDEQNWERLVIDEGVARIVLDTESSLEMISNFGSTWMSKKYSDATANFIDFEGQDSDKYKRHLNKRSAFVGMGKTLEELQNPSR